MQITEAFKGKTLVITGGTGSAPKVGCIVQHGESSRKSEALLETAVTMK